MKYNFAATLWLYNGQGTWHFITVPPDVSTDIKEIYGSKQKRGFGSVRVRVTIGKSTWQTSVFPDSKSGYYILPIKKSIRQKEALLIDKKVQVYLQFEA